MKILVICNMVPVKLRKVLSSGMVLCAKNPDTKVVELISVPEGAKVGDRILHEGLDDKWKPVQPEAVKEYGIWDNVAKELKSNGNRVSEFSGKPLMVKGLKEHFLAPTLENMFIS